LVPLNFSVVVAPLEIDVDLYLFNRRDRILAVDFFHYFSAMPLDALVAMRLTRGSVTLFRQIRYSPSDLLYVKVVEDTLVHSASEM